ncbi:HAD-IIB family hydrolase [Micromonospora sp. NPDC006766]|uniref:HAD-IIB family hydrolase n=1 Tax=Micromonospora sp. NPDC006766 TaxID=3154778 RepID=UPI0033E44734
MNDLRVVAFDLDDTLAVSKSQIDGRMAELLGHLLGEVDVLIISGGRFEQFEAQVLTHLDLPEDKLRRLHLMPTCGTRYLRWQDGDWRLVYAEDLSEADKARIIAALTESAKALGLWEAKTWGDIIEDRDSQITFSALGQTAPPAEKYGWDPDGSKKRRLRDAVAEKLPDLEVRGGGSTSIDVTRKGVDKAYGMRKLLECLDLKHDNVLFVGDRLDHGGNDYPVKAMGIKCHSVTCWQETADYVEALVDGLVKRRTEPA